MWKTYCAVNDLKFLPLLLCDQNSIIYFNDRTEQQ